MTKEQPITSADLVSGTLTLVEVKRADARRLRTAAKTARNWAELERRADALDAEADDLVAKAAKIRAGS